MEKILNKDNFENTVARVIFRADDNEEYECVGVLIKEEKDSIRIAFNSKNDKVKDYLDIKRLDIINIDVLDPSEIEEYNPNTFKCPP
jgi:hypothetical protein